MGKICCTKCGNEVKLISKYKNGNGIIQSKMPKRCQSCGSTSFEYTAYE